MVGKGKENAAVKDPNEIPWLTLVICLLLLIIYVWVQGLYK